MTGERTPSNTRASDDDISLREHMQRQIDVVRESGQHRLGMEREHADDRVAFLKEYLESILAEMDKRYEQRFVGQQEAVRVALDRVDKEFHEHIRSVREETQAALDAADKAILKQEAAIEKRFDAVNAFRAQLADQASSFLPRKESDVRMDAITEKIDRNSELLNALQLQVSSRLDLTQGHTAGGREAIQEKRASNGAMYAAVGFGISLLMALIAVTTIIIASRP